MEENIEFIQEDVKELRKEVDGLKNVIIKLVKFNDELLSQLEHLPRKNNPFAAQIIMYEIIKTLIKKDKFKKGTSVAQIVEDMEKLIKFITDDTSDRDYWESFMSVQSWISLERQAFQDYKNCFGKDNDVFYAIYRYYGCFPPKEIRVEIKDDKLLDFKLSRQELSDNLDLPIELTL